MLYSPLATGIGLVYSFLPFMILPIYVSLEKLDRRLIEAAFDLGADRWHALTRIILPLSMPGIVGGLILVFVPCLGAFVTPALLGGGKSLMIGSLIQQQFGQSRNWPFGAALAFVLLALILCALLFHALRYRRARGAPRMTRAGDLWRFPGTRAAAFAVLAYLYLPIVVLVVLSFNASDSSLARWEGFSTHWYAVAAADGNMVHSIEISLTVACIATLVGTIVATLAALATSRTRFRGQIAVEALLGLPLIVPDIVAAIAILLFFVMVGIGLGLSSLVLAHTVFTIPIAYLPIRARLEGLDPALAEAAADLYANPWQSLRRIILPLIWPGILSGAMLAFIGSLGDVVVSYFISGPGSTTLPVYVFSMVRMGVTPTVNAVSTLLIAASASLLTLSYLLGRRFN